RALRADGRGRHTTTYRALIPLPGGGAVLDTPGVRQVGLFDSTTGLSRAFADIAELASACRFRDCGHGMEPGCAVQAAIDDATLPARGLANWRKLQRELAMEPARAAAPSSRRSRKDTPGKRGKSGAIWRVVP